MARTPLQLPIDDVEGKVRELLRQPDPLVVVAETGSGKSTRLPLWFADEHDGPVVVVEPRRVACRSLAGFLASQRDERPGQSIGYRVRFDDRSSAATQVLFVTPGVALRMLADDGLRGVGVVVDEFHERGWQVDLLVAAMLERRDRKTPLVITSATIDGARVTEQVGGTLVEAEGRSYPIDITYLDEPAMPTVRDVEDRVVAGVRRMIDALPTGDILVFLPGMAQIRRCEDALSELSRRHDLELVVVHGSLPPERVARAFVANSPRRRVFLSTNVAETSVTLPGVRAVLDSGLVRSRIHRAGRAALALVPIARSSMDQRAGRAGRVAAGRCLRLWSERYRPSEATAPEVARIELDDVVLQAALAGLDGDRFTSAPWIDPPPAFAVEQARQHLRELGALDDQWKLTDRGRKLGALPVEAEEAQLLVGVDGPMASAMCDIIALLQSRSGFLRPIGELPSVRQHEVRDARDTLLVRAFDEVTTQLRLLRRGDPRRHHLFRAPLEQCRRIAASLRQLAGVAARFPDDEPVPARKQLVAHLLRRWPDAAFVVRARALGARNESRRRSRGRPWGNGDIEVMVDPFTPWRRTDAEDAKPPRAGIVLETEWIGGMGTRVIGVGRMVVPAKYAELAAAELGDLTVADVTIDKGRVPVVIGEEARVLAGVELERERRPLRGRALCDAAAELVLENRLIKGAAEPVRDDLFHWRLLLEWDEADHGRTDPEAAAALPEPRDWIAEQLWVLGVRTSEDLQLVEPNDLRPDLESELGIASWILDAFREDFPRIWTYQGGDFTVEVRVRARRVTIEPANAAARRAQEPRRSHVPRFRGLRVDYRKASRVVRLR